MNKHLRFSVLFALFVVLATVLVACGPKATEAPAVEEKIKVGSGVPGCRF